MGRERISGLGITQKDRRYGRVEYTVSSGFMLLYLESILALGWLLDKDSTPEMMAMVRTSVSLAQYSASAVAATIAKDGADLMLVLLKRIEFIHRLKKCLSPSGITSSV